MKVYYIYGNPIAFVLCSAFFSIVLIALTVATYVNKELISIPLVFFVCFVTVFNYICLIVFYGAYRKGINAFMSPQKYKKAIKANQNYLSNCEALGTALVQANEKYNNINADEAIKKAIELIGEIKKA